jgi:hypothetical protein
MVEGVGIVEIVGELLLMFGYPLLQRTKCPLLDDGEVFESPWGLRSPWIQDTPGRQPRPSSNGQSSKNGLFDYLRIMWTSRQVVESP